MDETTLSLHPPLRRCWTKRGQRHLVPAPGQQQWVHLFGAYNWRTDAVSWHTASHKNSESFVAFLDHLLRQCYPTQTVILVLDNASYHKSRAALAALSLFEDRLLTLWLPPYNPFLNPIERFWRHLKDIAAANVLYPSLAAWQTQVQQALLTQNNSLAPDRFVFSKVFPLPA